MKNALVFMFMMSVGAFAQAVTLPVNVLAGNGKLVRSEIVTIPSSQTQSLSDYLGFVGDYTTDTNPVSMSSHKDVYYLDVKVSGFWHSVQARFDFYVETLTQANQERIYNAIKANYATKGLPACLLKDQFVLESDQSSIIMYTYAYNPDITTVNIPATWSPVPNGYSGAGSIDVPLTSCWNVQKLY